MRKSWIPEEQEKELVKGSFNLKNDKFPQGSILMELENSIKINSTIIDWFQNPTNGEQLGINEVLYSFDGAEDILNNHVFSLWNGQTPQIASIKPIWEIKVNARKILFYYIYAQIRKYRVFSELGLNDVEYLNLDDAIYAYINDNIINQYNFFTVDLYILPFALSQGGFYNKPIWDSTLDSIQNEQYIVKNLQIKELEKSFKQIQVMYNQTFNPNIQTFKYYFNLYYKRI